MNAPHRYDHSQLTGPGTLSAPKLGPSFPGGISGRRPYMGGLGRFLTEARLAERLGGEHPYAYALNNPTTYVDPDGMQPKKPWKGIPPRVHKEMIISGIVVIRLPGSAPPYIKFPALGWTKIHLGYGNYCGGDRNPLAECPPIHLPPPHSWDSVDNCCVGHDRDYNRLGCDWVKNISPDCRAADARLCDCLKRTPCPYPPGTAQEICEAFRDDAILWFCNVKPRI